MSGALPTPPAPPLRTRNVVLMMVDGVRWQEVFRGADPRLLAGVPEADVPEAGMPGEDEQEQVRRAFGGVTPAARREALLPFLWSVVARQGTVLGNHDLGSRCAVTNGRNLSYPGYSETLCGFVGPAIVDNEHGPNPNVTVFEWLARQPDWRRGEIGVFGAWDGIGEVFHEGRAPFAVNVGYDPLTEGRTTSGIALLNRLKAELPRGWADEPYDPLTFRTALEWIAANGPRLTFLGLGEPDEWAHHGDYGRYLQSTRRWDAAVGELWAILQLLPQYRDTTTLILTCDHGRGDGPRWTDHGTDTPGSEATWLAFLGPDTPAAGEAADEQATNDGIAATIARLLGYDYCAAEPRAGAPIDAAFG